MADLQRQSGKMAAMLDEPGIVTILIQVVVGLVVAYIIYLVSMFAIRSDRLYIDSKYDMSKKSKVKVIDGYIDASAIKKRVYPTQIIQHPDYVPIRPSMNMKGGAQFSYGFWIYAGAADAVVGKTIFLKGDPKMYTYTVTDSAGVSRTVSDRVAFCPMVSFGAKAMEFVVTFNTIGNMRETLNVQRITSDSTVSRQNILSLFSAKWILITIVFEDNVPINDFENGLMVKFYVNDILYQVGRYKTTIKQNNGDLVLFPDDIPLENCKIADFTYYNYAIGDAEIRSVAVSGPPSKTSINLMGGASFISPDMVSDYNKMDLYNT